MVTKHKQLNCTEVGREQLKVCAKAIRRRCHEQLLHRSDLTNLSAHLARHHLELKTERAAAAASRRTVDGTTNKLPRASGKQKRIPELTAHLICPFVQYKGK